MPPPLDTLRPKTPTNCPLQLLLGIITIGPWALFLIYDLLLFTVRSLYHEIPYYGGRAQGKRRPRAPTLTERPGGRRRTFSISGSAGGSTGLDGSDDGGVKKREGDVGRGEASAVFEED